MEELTKMKQFSGSYEPSTDCRDFLVDIYDVEVAFDMADFQ